MPMNKTNCEACNPPEKYKKLDLKEYKYWLVGLHSNQCYLGRSVIILKRHLEDMFDITEDEKNELFVITKHLRDTLRSAFHPDLFNYATLGNGVSHVHLHVVPRYKQPVTFQTHVFQDLRWGKNYSGYDKSFSIPQEILMLIHDKIRSLL